jgi:hypothetical protein
MGGIDGDLHGSQFAQAEPEEEELRPVIHQNGYLVPFPQAQGLKPGGHPIRLSIKILIPQGPVLEIEKIPVAVLGYLLPEDPVNRPFMN